MEYYDFGSILCQLPTVHVISSIVIWIPLIISLSIVFGHILKKYTPGTDRKDTSEKVKQLRQDENQDNECLESGSISRNSSEEDIYDINTEDDTSEEDIYDRITEDDTSEEDIYDRITEDDTSEEDIYDRITEDDTSEEDIYDRITEDDTSEEDIYDRITEDDTSEEDIYDRITEDDTSEEDIYDRITEDDTSEEDIYDRITEDDTSEEDIYDRITEDDTSEEDIYDRITEDDTSEEDIYDRITADYVMSYSDYYDTDDNSVDDIVIRITKDDVSQENMYTRTTEDDGTSYSTDGSVDDMHDMGLDNTFPFKRRLGGATPDASEYIDAADIPSSIQQWHNEEITSEISLNSDCGDTQQTLESMMQIKPCAESTNSAEPTCHMNERYPPITEDGHHGNTEHQVLQRGPAGDATETTHMYALTQVSGQQEQEQTVPKLPWTPPSERNVEHGNHDHHDGTVNEDPEINFSLQESQTLVKTVQSADKEETKPKEI